MWNVPLIQMSSSTHPIYVLHLFKSEIFRFVSNKLTNSNNKTLRIWIDSLLFISKDNLKMESFSKTWWCEMTYFNLMTRPMKKQELNVSTRQTRIFSTNWLWASWCHPIVLRRNTKAHWNQQYKLLKIGPKLSIKEKARSEWQDSVHS